MFRVVRKKSAGAAMRRVFPTKIRGYGSQPPSNSRDSYVVRVAPSAFAWGAVGARARASRGGVRWHTAARTPVASHSQPLSLRRGVGCPGGGKFTYLPTALPGPHRAVCAQTGANTRRPPAGRGHEFTRGHVQHDVAPRAWRVPAVARPAARRRVCAARR